MLNRIAVNKLHRPLSSLLDAPKTTRIVIIGGGSAGINCAQTLAKLLTPADNTEVVLLEKSAFYYHPIGAPRAFVDASFTPKLFLPYDKVIPEAAANLVTIARAVATRILAGKTNRVTYHTIGPDDKESGYNVVLDYDYLVIATGSTYTVPIKPDPRASNSRADTEAQLAEVRAQIAGADSILIVGGGAVGCEVAGDIAARYPNKRVTIVDAASKLVASANLRDAFRDKLMNSMKELNVNVVLGERLTERLGGNSFEKQTLVTDKGTRLESDIQLLCGGFHPAAELVQNMDASLVDERGFIKVNMQMQVASERLTNVFALGDTSNHPTPKLSMVASQQGAFLTKELVAVIRKTAWVHQAVPKEGDRTNAADARTERRSRAAPSLGRSSLWQLPHEHDQVQGLLRGHDLERTPRDHAGRQVDISAVDVLFCLRHAEIVKCSTF